MLADRYEKEQKIVILTEMGRHASVSCLVETCCSTFLDSRPIYYRILLFSHLIL